jgi:hypothetical protein
MSFILPASCEFRLLSFPHIMNRIGRSLPSVRCPLGIMTRIPTIGSYFEILFLDHFAFWPSMVCG